MALTVRVRGGTRKARRFLRSIGLSVKGCRLLPGDAKPEYSPYGVLRRRGGRLAECKVPCDDRTGRVVREHFKKTTSPIFDFDDRCHHWRNYKG